MTAGRSAPTTPPRRHLAWADIALAAALVVAVHLGPASAVLSAPHWTDWATAAVLTVAAGKITLFTAWGPARPRADQAGTLPAKS